MKEEEKIICDFMYNFTNENWDKINKEKCELLKVTKENFLKDIKKNVETALWVFTEVCVWGMNTEYLRELICQQIDESDFCVIKINNRYIKLRWNGNTYDIGFCEPKTKTVIYFE